MKFNKLILMVMILLTACLSSSPSEQNQNPPINSQANPPTVAPQLPHVDVLDITHLPLGDNKISASPQRGYVYSCMTQFNSAGGAQATGNWINSDGTWDSTKKLFVDGSTSWQHSLSIIVQSKDRIFISNDLPDHTTGNFPISPNDDAYQVDRNPNSIKGQNINFSIPANPTLAAQPTCVGGEVGIMLSGVLIFSAFDAEGHDAVAHEAQDNCDGHPQKDGFYHYHSLSNCIPDNKKGHSALMGYAFDGFGIYGYYGEDGKELTNADLDECHGHTRVIEWNGQMVEMYHYHATREFPYVVGCFRGTPSVMALTAENSGAGQGQLNGNQPPQDAINACLNLSEGAACTFNIPNRRINGTCGLPANSQQLTCIPAGGPP